MLFILSPTEILNPGSFGSLFCFSHQLWGQSQPWIRVTSSHELLSPPLSPLRELRVFRQHFTPSCTVQSVRTRQSNGLERVPPAEAALLLSSTRHETRRRKSLRKTFTLLPDKKQGSRASSSGGKDSGFLCTQHLALGFSGEAEAQVASTYLMSSQTSGP